MSRLVAEMSRKLTLTGFFAADRIDLAFLQRAQKLDLRFERQLADLVEEQRAAVGLLELADAAVDGARERALLVAEQDALDQVLRDRAAVDRDERLSGALALALNGARDQLLADAALAFDREPECSTPPRACRARSRAACLAADDEIVEGERALGLLLDAADHLAGQRFDLHGAA